MLAGDIWLRLGTGGPSVSEAPPRKASPELASPPICPVNQRVVRGAKIARDCGVQHLRPSKIRNCMVLNDTDFYEDVEEREKKHHTHH
jgi:hypothetical protein